jgi:hypothetical protein
VQERIGHECCDEKETKRHPKEKQQEVERHVTNQPMM